MTTKDDWPSSIEITICDLQGDIYRYAAKENYDMKLFSNAYLNSDFCKRQMDAKYSRYQLADEMECMDFIIPEIGDFKDTAARRINYDVAAWIGWMYRFISIYKHISSADLCKLIPFDMMCAYYVGMHTIEERNAADIMVETAIKRNAVSNSKE